DSSPAAKRASSIVVMPHTLICVIAPYSGRHYASMQLNLTNGQFIFDLKPLGWDTRAMARMATMAATDAKLTDSWVGQIDLRLIRESVSTPVFIYSEAQLLRNIGRINEAA